MTHNTATKTYTDAAGKKMKKYFEVHSENLNNRTMFILETTDGVASATDCMPCDENDRLAACTAADNRTQRSFLGEKFSPSPYDEEITDVEVIAHYQKKFA